MMMKNVIFFVIYLWGWTLSLFAFAQITIKNCVKNIYIVLTFCIIIFSFSDEFFRQIIDIPCIYSLILGVECWGCGLKSAIVALIHGNLDLAYQINANSFVVVATVVFGLLHNIRSTGGVWLNLHFTNSRS